MEEHRPKRRKVQRIEGLAVGEYNLEARRERARSPGDKMEIVDMPKLVLPAPGDRQRVQRLQQPPNSSRELSTKIHARQLFPTQANSFAQPAADSASTILAIAVIDGNGIVSELDVPMASKTVWIPGYGELPMTNGATVPTVTMTNGAAFPTATAPETKSRYAEFNPAAVTPPPAVAASQARGQALQTQEAIAKQLNVVPQAPPSVASIPSSTNPVPTSDAPIPSSTEPVPTSDAPIPSSAESAQHASTSQASMASMVISLPESHTQQVLSSPSTPVPTTPQSSASSSVSYFSSSSASVPNSASSQTTNTPISSQVPTTQNSQLQTSDNSTVPSTSSSTSSISTSAASAASSASSSLSSLSSGSSAVTSSVPVQSATSQASIFSVESLAALTSGTHNLSGFATSTRSSQDLSSGLSSTQIVSTPTTLASSPSASSHPLSQSASASSLSGTASSTGLGAGGVGSSGNTATSTAPSPTSSSGAGSGDSSTPPTPVLVGGIVGGVAGAAMILLILLLLFRWRRGKIGQRRNLSPPTPQTLEPAGVQQAGNMTQRSSSTPIAAAGFFGRLRPTSAQTATTADTAPSERGFQKVSGRKLPSVLASGGDGYGEASAGAAAGPSAAVAAGGIAARAAGTTDATAGSSSWATASSSTEPAAPASRGKGIVPNQGPFTGLAPALRPSPPHSLSGSSFYRDSRGFYGGVVPEETTQEENDAFSSPSTSPSYPAPLNIAGIGSSSNSLPHNRPGPARTPVINEPATIPIRTPSRARQQPSRLVQATPSPQNPSRDRLGRSHPSQDGSPGSRFQEDTTPP